MDIRTLFSITSSIALLPVLSAALFIVYMHKKEYLENVGFGRPEVGMILVGSSFGLVADIPLIVSNEALLNINLGGALIPIIISGSLIYKKKLDWKKYILGIAIIAASSFYLTRYEPNLGIVAEFPQYLIPSGIAIALGFILERDIERKIPFAYVSSVIGVLIGADLVRIPMLVNEGVLGSIGGAGAMDLVYLSGLIAAIPLIMIYYSKQNYSRSSNIIKECRKMLDNKEYPSNITFCKNVVEYELLKSVRIISRLKNLSNNHIRMTRENILQYLGIHPYIIRDYRKLKDMKNISKKQSRKSLITSYLLSNAINKRLNELFTSLGNRIAAYIVDLTLLLAPFLVFFLYVFPRYQYVQNISFPIIVAIVSLGISIQFIYFTITEWYFGASLGKMILGLEVVSDDFSDMSFIQSAARNSARYADILLFFYLISILLIINKPEKKRIGDYVGGTRVVKVK